MFVEATDFELEPYVIPNLEDPDETLEDYADQEEAIILKQLMGSVLYEQFTLGLADLVPDQKWIDLRDGAAYTYGGTNYLYYGVKAFLRPYIWYRWTGDGEIKKAQSGGNLAVAENSEKVSLSMPLARAYNDFLSQTGFEHCDENTKNTLYGFLTAKEADYPDWVNESELEMINPWNI